MTVRSFAGRFSANNGSGRTIGLRNECPYNMGLLIGQTPSASMTTNFVKVLTVAFAFSVLGVQVIEVPNTSAAANTLVVRPFWP
jgi:hypothetical protein